MQERKSSQGRHRRDERGTGAGDLRLDLHARNGRKRAETGGGGRIIYTPWRPSDLAQRDGRAVRKGNEIAKFFAGNNVDVIIYAVEKSLDSYKFNLLHCKQTFISQLKSGAMGARTIDEGAMDEKSGMNFSEYMAILSGNTDLLDKARLEKKVAALESERKTFHKAKSASSWKLEDYTKKLAHNNDCIVKMTADYEAFLARVQTDKEGNKLNAVRLDGLEATDHKSVGHACRRSPRMPRRAANTCVSASCTVFRCS